MRTWQHLLAALLILSGTTARAFVLGDGDELDAGQTLTVENETVELRFLGSSASGENDFVWDAFAPDGRFSCKQTRPGYTVTVGSYGAASEIAFLLHTFFDALYASGPADGGGDQVAHARLQQTGPNTVLIGWEDSGGGGDLDYNDCTAEIVITPAK